MTWLRNKCSLCCVKPERIWNLSVIAASFPILIRYPSKLQGWACIPGLSQSVHSVPPATEVSSEADILPKSVQLKERLFVFQFWRKEAFSLLLNVNKKACSKTFCNGLRMKPTYGGKKRKLKKMEPESRSNYAWSIMKNLCIDFLVS